MYNIPSFITETHSRNRQTNPTAETNQPKGLAVHCALSRSQDPNKGSITHSHDSQTLLHLTRGQPFASFIAEAHGNYLEQE